MSAIHSSAVRRAHTPSPVAKTKRQEPSKPASVMCLAGRMTSKQVTTHIRACLTPDLLKGAYKKQWTSDKPKSWGHCYVSCETYYHLMGGKAAGLKPHWVKHEGGTHIFLRDAQGKVIDPTWDQFRAPPPYEQAKPFGWMTGETPSKRAQVLLERVRTRLPDAFVEG